MDLAHGRTAAIDVELFTVDVDGVRSVLDGTGLTVTLELIDRAGGIIPTAGKVDWLVEADGTVRYEPASTDLQAGRSPYAARFLVTDGAGAVLPVPDIADIWKVHQ